MVQGHLLTRWKQKHLTAHLNTDWSSKKLSITRTPERVLKDLLHFRGRLEPWSTSLLRGAKCSSASYSSPSSRKASSMLSLARREHKGLQGCLSIVGLWPPRPPSAPSPLKTRRSHHRPHPRHQHIAPSASAYPARRPSQQVHDNKKQIVDSIGKTGTATLTAHTA